MSRRVSQGQATRSKNVMERFLATIMERGPEVQEIFEAVHGDERVSQGFRTGIFSRYMAFMEAPEEYHEMTNGSRDHYWAEFCITHGIDGERFKALMDPVLDIGTGLVTQNVETGRIRPCTFRDIAEGSGSYINLIDMIIGPESNDDAPREYTALKIWLKIAHYLALNLSVPTPAWMEP